MSSVGQSPRAARTVTTCAGAVTDPVYVVVLNWNGERDTAACLDSFLCQRGVQTEILLVDNASTDGSGERLRERYSSISYLQTGANLGYTGGNNCGIAWALARGAAWILVVNNDTVADPDCVQRLLAAAASDERLAAVAPLIVRCDDPARVWFAGGRFDQVRAVGVHENEGALASAVTADILGGQHQAWRPCTFLTGCCLLLRSSALQEVGGFRDDFFAYCEDLELSLRLLRAKWRIAWVPAARIAHRVPPRDAEATPAQIFLRDRNRRRLVRLHYALGWRLAFALWFWPTRMVHVARYLVRGEGVRARAILRGMRAR